MTRITLCIITIMVLLTATLVAQWDPTNERTPTNVGAYVVAIEADTLTGPVHICNLPQGAIIDHIIVVTDEWQYTTRIELRLAVAESTIADLSVSQTGVVRDDVAHAPFVEGEYLIAVFPEGNEQRGRVRIVIVTL